MHDRNIFKDKKPDFQQLALEYEEFSPFVHRGVSGKSYVNFKDPASLRALTVVLLKKYFNISIEIPLDRLIPTVPLRLNYVHWIEDLVDYKNNENVIGIDIGCGASCIYPLLFYKLNGWDILSTDINDKTIEYAIKNVNLNHAEEHIKVIKNKEDDSIFEGVLAATDSATIDFTLCNPPFFAETEENVFKNRTGHRPPPASFSTASDNESCTSGGEVTFVKRMIIESLLLKEKIRWYTTMLGKKSSLKELLKYLKANNQIKTVTSTEFKQGRTMRWGLAWSFTEELKDNSAKLKKKKKLNPFYLLPSEQFLEEHKISVLSKNMSTKDISLVLWDIAKVICHTLSRLEVSFEDAEYITLMNRDAYEITGCAYKNTWSRQRKKRRNELNTSLSRDNLTADNTVTPGVDTVTFASASEVKCQTSECNLINAAETTRKRKLLSHDDEQCKKSKLSQVLHSDASIQMKTCKMDEFDEALFSFSCTVATDQQFSCSENDKAMVSFLCMEGDREQFHQMFQYLINIFNSEQVRLKK